MLTKERELEIREQCLREWRPQLNEMRELIAEIDKLRSESCADFIERLKWIGIQSTLVQDLMKERDQLRERVAKLREALNLFGHVGNDTKCCEDCRIRIEALAQDDEAAK